MEIFNKGEPVETLSPEEKEIFKRILQDYLRYAAIAENMSN